MPRSDWKILLFYAATTVLLPVAGKSLPPAPADPVPAAAPALPANVPPASSAPAAPGTTSPGELPPTAPSDSAGSGTAPPTSVTMPPVAAAGAMPPLSAKAVSAPVDPAFVPSYRDWTQSLMFPEPQIGNLRKLLTYYESHRSAASEAPSEVSSNDAVNQILDHINAANKNEAPEATPPYPVFRLGTILLDPINGSSVALNGKLLPPGNASGDITVNSVNATSASFLWKPANKLLAAQFVKDRKARRKNAGPATTPPESSRIASIVPEKNASTSPASVRFTLRPNQSFTPQWMAIYEGSAPGAAPVGGSAMVATIPHMGSPASAPNGTGLPPGLTGSTAPPPSASGQPTSAAGLQTVVNGAKALKAIADAYGGAPALAAPVTAPVAPGAGPVTAAAAVPMTTTLTGTAGRSANMADTTPAVITATVDRGAPVANVQTPATPLKSVTEITPNIPGAAPVVVANPASLPSVNTIP